MTDTTANGSNAVNGVDTEMNSTPPSSPMRDTTMSPLNLDTDSVRNKLPYEHSVHEKLKTIAGISGNVLEWYDFAVFGFFGDISEFDD